MKRIVLDASALLAFLEDSAGASEIEELLQRAVMNDASILVPVSSWSSVCTAVWHAKGKRDGDHVLQQLTQLPLSFVDLDHSAARKAAELAAESQAPILISFSAAVAWQQKATLVMADGIPQALEKQVRVQRVGNLEKEKTK